MQSVGLVVNLSPWNPGGVALLVYAALVLAVLGLLLVLTRWLGERRGNEEKLRAYESGVIPTGGTGFQYPVPFYLVAVFFLIFDVEAAFIFAWAVGFRELGWAGWLQITFFIAFLMAGLAYVWCKGGLSWGTKE